MHELIPMVKEYMNVDEFVKTRVLPEFQPIVANAT
jgi:hypothetical protein